MENPATIADLRLYGYTGSDETGEAWLDAAWLVLNAAIKTLDDLVDDGKTTVDLIRYVVCQMALRVLRNPGGRKSESITIDDATRSWSLDDRVSSGLLYLADDESALLTGTQAGKAFSVMPS